MFKKSISIVAMAVALVSFGSSAASGAGPDYGDVTVHAKVPTPPGYPEGIAVTGNRMVVAGPATFGTIGKGPSEVLLYDKTTGELVKSYPMKGENLLAEHANSSLAFDGKGRMYVLNTQLGVVRLSFDGTQHSYSKPFPDLPTCLLVLPGTPCSPTLVDMPPLPNDIAFDNAGNAYVTDSMQATIWRVRAGGGAPQIWFQDSRLASEYIGVNGLRLNPARTHVYFTVTTDLLGQGWVYRLPVKNPTAGALEVVHHYAMGEGPDGIAFGENGHLYVALAVPYQSGISVLRVIDGVEEARFTNPLGSPINPYDSPANIAFDGEGSLLVTNHAFATGNLLPDQFSVLKVWVKDGGSALAKPLLP
ncbi:MAG: SMP-30/gluconolactonase/LRE family protein [Acidimicrobiales bacterium]